MAKIYRNYYDPNVSKDTSLKDMYYKHKANEFYVGRQMLQNGDTQLQELVDINDKLASLDPKKQIYRQTADIFSKGILGPLDYVMPDFIKDFGFYMGSKAHDIYTSDKDDIYQNNKQEYKNLVKRQREIAEPYTINYSKEIDNRIKIIQDKLKKQASIIEQNREKGNYNPGSRLPRTSLTPVGTYEYGMLNTALQDLQDSKEEIDNYLKSPTSIGLQELGRSFIKEKNVRDYLSAGMLPGIDYMYKISGAYNMKKNGGKPTNEAEEALLTGMVSLNEVQGMNLQKDRSWYRAGNTIASSLSMMESMFLTMGAGEAAFTTTKGITTGLTKKWGLDVAETLGKKSLKNSLEVIVPNLVKPAVMVGLDPQHTLKFAGDKYTENAFEIEMPDGTKKMMIGKPALKAMVDSIQFKINEIDDKIAKSTNKEQVDELLQYKKELLAQADYFGSVEDLGLFNSLLYGYSQNYRETLTETVGGDAITAGLSKFGGTIANRLGFSTVPGLLGKTGSKIYGTYTRGINSLNKFIEGTGMNKLTRAINMYAGAGHVVHGVPEEILEEVMGAMLPSYKENYWENLSQLGTKDFWVDTALSTLIQGSVMSGGGHLLNTAINSKAVRQQLKDTEAALDMYNKIANFAGNDSDLIQHIAMGTAGTYFTNEEYENKINELKNKGDEKGAERLRERKFTNQALNAIRLGKVEDFKEALRRQQTNPNLSSETQESIQKGLKMVDVLDKTVKEHNDKIGRGKIINNTFYNEIAKSNNITIDKEIAESIDKIKDSELLKSISPDFLNLIHSYINNEDLTTEELENLAKIQKTENIDVIKLLNLGFLKEQNIETIKNTERQINYYTNPVNQEKIKKELFLEQRDNLKESIKDISNEDVLKDLVKGQDKELSELAQKRLKQVGIEKETGLKTTRELKIEDIELGTLNSKYNEISNEDLNKQVKDKLKSIGENLFTDLDNNIGKEGTLKDLLYSVAAEKGNQHIAQNFHKYALAAEYNGRKWEGNLDDLYSEIVENTNIDILNIPTNKKADIQPNSIVKEIQKNTSPATSITPLSQEALEVRHKEQKEDSKDNEDRRTDRPDPHVAHYHLQGERLSDTLFIVRQKGLKQHYIKLAENQFLINNNYILDHGFLEYLRKNKMPLTVVPIDDDSIEITDVIDGERIKTTWGKYKQTYKPNEQHYADMVPMAIYFEGIPIGMLQQVTWHRLDNYSDNVDNKQKIVQEGYTKQRDIRTAVMQGNNVINFTEIGFGNIDTLNQHVDKTPITINEATGNSTLAIMKFEDGQMVLRGNDGNRIKLELLQDIQAKDGNGNYIYDIGHTYDIRPTGMKNADGEDLHMLLRVFYPSPIAPQENIKQTLNSDLFNTSKFLLLSSILLNNKNNVSLIEAIRKEYNFTLQQAEEIDNKYKGQVQKAVVPIINSLVRFNNKFIPGTLQLIEISNPKNTEKTLSSSLGYRISQTDEIKSLGYTLPFNTSIDEVISEINKLFNTEKGVFKNTMFNVNEKAFYNNRSIHIIDSKGNISSTKSYTDLVKDNLKTNVLSHKIETPAYGDTKEGEKWIVDVQPMIYYQLENQVNKTSDKVLEDAVNKTLNQLDNKNTLLDELSEEEKKLLSTFNNQADRELESRFNRTQDIQEQIERLSSNQIPGLSLLQTKELLSQLKNEIMIRLAQLDKITNGDIVRVIKESLSGLEQDLKNNIALKEKVENIIKDKNLQSQDSLLQQIQDRITKLESILENRDKIISMKTDNLGELTKQINSTFGIDLNDIDDYEGEEEHSHSKSFLENEIKMTFSKKLIVSLFGIERKNSIGDNMLNFLGNKRYYGVDEEVYPEIMMIVSTIGSNIELLLKTLDDKYAFTKRNIYSDIRNKINNFSEQLQNELLYRTISERATYLKVMNSFRKDSDGTVKSTITMFDENFKKQDIQLKQRIKRDFLTSRFSQQGSKGSLLLNKTYSTSIQKRLQEIIDAGKKLSVEETRKIFDGLGLELINTNTIEKYLQLFDPIDKNRGGILYYINSQLKILNSKDGDINLLDSENNLFNESGKSLSQLIELDIELKGNTLSKSIRVGDKQMQALVASTSLFGTLRKLKETNSELMAAMKTDAITSNNIFLKALGNDQFFENVDIEWTSPEAYKVHGKDIFDDADYDKLADTDNLAMLLGMYFDTKSYGKLRNESLGYEGLSFRMGRAVPYVFADKGRMTPITTVLLNLADSITFNEQGQYSIPSEVLDFIVEQVFTNQLNRIINSYKINPGIINYDKGSKLFSSISSFNKIEYKGRNIHEYLSLDGIENNKDIINGLKQSAKNKILDFIKQEVDTKIDEKGYGEFRELGFYTETQLKNGGTSKKINNIDHKVLSARKGNDLIQKLRSIAVEYTINHLVSMETLQNVFLQDAAFFNNSKTLNSIFSDGIIDTSKITDTNTLNLIEIELAASLQKRAAMEIAPGNILANADNKKLQNNTSFLHLALKDNSTISKDIVGLIERGITELSQEQKDVLDIIRKELKKEKPDTNIIKNYENTFPGFESFFDMKGTDAQEYSTWKSHINLIYRQGRLSLEEKKMLKEAYQNLSKGIKVSNKILDFLLQPIKPVYSGPVIQGGLIVPVYIKSSSFPLLPQLTKNLKLDKIRQLAEDLEEKHGKDVSISYQSANKIGAKNTKLTVQDIYDNPIDKLDLSSALTLLPTNNRKIQQETPSKEDKFFHKGKDSYITMPSQMFKVLFGNGVNKIEDKIFPADFFHKSLLDEAGVIIENNLISGIDLDKLDTYIYKKYSNLQKTKLFNELGINNISSFHELSLQDKNNIISNLDKIIKKEIVSRGLPTYLQDAAELINEDGINKTTVPLLLDPNSHKFESLLQSIISNRLIKHELPGNSHIVGSSEGFEKIGSFEEYDDKNGIIWLDDRDDLTLKSTRKENGKLEFSEILIRSHYKYTDKDGNYKYVDLSEDYIKHEDGTETGYSEPIIRNNKIVGRKLRLDRIDPELLSMFSLRIPTSSHQSGVMIKVVGFLPSASADLLIAPAEHTVQLGEDYDVDKRYIFKSNYFTDDNGNIKKLTKESRKYFIRQFYNYQEKKELLLDELGDIDKEISSDLNNKFDKLLNAIFGEESSEEVTKEYYELLNSKKSNKEKEIVDVDEKIQKLRKKIWVDFDNKLLENNMIDIYKSVYSTTDDKIQSMISKPLVTDVAETTAKAMYKLLSSENINENFSIYSDSFQRKMLKAGSSGKLGVAIHSNAVTLESMLQRSNKNIQKLDFEEYIGELHSTGKLGKIRTVDGKRHTADQHGENQNVAVDNINKQLMDKRNENSHTMAAFVGMAHLGFDQSKHEVNTGIGVIANLHIPSLLINQPIIRDYVEMMDAESSMTSEFSYYTETKVISQLTSKYGFKLNMNEPLVEEEKYTEISKTMSPENLWKYLTHSKATENYDAKLFQLAVLQKFLKFKSLGKELQKFQQLINLSSRQLGISYFETLQRIDMLDDLVNNESISNLSSLIGDYIPRDEAERTSEDLTDYILIGQNYWKPLTKEGIMLINSLHAASLIMPLHFPYNNAAIQKVLVDVFSMRPKGVDELKDKSKASMKLKYAIMSGLNDFLSAQSDITPDSVSLNRKRLFISTSDNMSLPAIIKDLQVKNHPIAQHPLLKDLTPILNQDNSGVDTIQHISDDSSIFDRSSKYDSFNELLQSDKVLGIYNGEEYTETMLAEDLATFAFIANNENGASGFRNYITTDYLKIFGVARRLRDYNTKMLNGGMGEELRRFVKQFIQHNPEYAYKLPFDEQKKFKGSEDFIKDFGKDTPPKFISIRNTEIISTNKPYNLYQHIGGGQYVKIDVLGTSKYNEYDAYAENQKSNLKNTNDAKDLTYMLPIGRLGYKNIDTNKETLVPTLPEDFKTVKGQLDFILKSSNTQPELKQFIENIYDLLDTDVPIMFTTSIPFGGYSETEHVIKLNPNIIVNAINRAGGSQSKANNIIREVLVEEVIHANTVIEFKKWVENEDEKGNITLKENAPLFATKILELYNQGKQLIPYDVKNLETYYSQDIYEFMAGMFVDDEYRKRLQFEYNKKFPHSEEKKSFVDRFKDIIKSFLKFLHTKKTGETLSYKDQMFDAIKDMLKTREEQKKQEKKSTIGTEVIKEVKESKIDIPEVKEEEIKTDKLNTFTNHSGGAYGGDTFWDLIGREFGVTNHKHYKDAGNANLSQQLRNKGVKAEILTKEQMDFARQKVKELLGIEYKNDLKGNLQVRNFYQVYNADAVYAVAKLNSDNKSVSGGTNTAIQLGIKLNKPVYVWDINNEQWYEFNNQKNNLPTSSETINIYAGDKQNAELSNFAIRPFTTNVETLSGEKQYTFQSVEQGFHFYKALVANNPQVAKQILATTNGGQLKRLTNRNNLKMSPEQVKEWDDTSKSIMLNLMYDSYEQNPKAAEKLLATGNAKITHTQDNTRWKIDFPEVVMIVRGMLKEEGFSNNEGIFQKTETPTLTKNFAGIGSRDIENYNVQKDGKWQPREKYVGKEKEEKAKQAIRDVYQQTLNNQENNQQQLEEQNSKYNFSEVDLGLNTNFTQEDFKCK